MTGAPVVPVAIHGSSKVRNWKRLQFPKVTVRYGDPIVWERVEDPTREQQQAVADEIFAEIKALYAELEAEGRKGVARRVRELRRAERAGARRPPRPRLAARAPGACRDRGIDRLADVDRASDPWCRGAQGRRAGGDRDRRRGLRGARGRGARAGGGARRGGRGARRRPGGEEAPFEGAADVLVYDGSAVRGDAGGARRRVADDPAGRDRGDDRPRRRADRAARAAARRARRRRPRAPVWRTSRAR